MPTPSVMLSLTTDPVADGVAEGKFRSGIISPSVSVKPVLILRVGVEAGTDGSGAAVTLFGM